MDDKTKTLIRELQAGIAALPIKAGQPAFNQKVELLNTLARLVRHLNHSDQPYTKNIDLPGNSEAEL